MKRPTIDQFFPESTSPKDLKAVFLNNPELYRYIQALDGYIDWLESNVDEELLYAGGCGKILDSNSSIGWCDDCRNQIQTNEEDWLKPHRENFKRFDDMLKGIQTIYGDLNIQEDKSLGPNEIRIIKIEKP